MVSIKSLLFLLLFIISQQSFSYPMFFKCDGNGHISDIQSNEEFNSLLDSFVGKTEEEIDSLIESICVGNKECLSELENLKDFMKINDNVLQTVLNEQKDKLAGGITAIDSNIPKLSHIAPLVKDALTCRNTVTNLKPEDFEGERDNIKLFYPYHSNYMYITGCKGIYGSEKCEAIDLSEIESAVESAMAVGADPYASIALAMMEEGANGLRNFYLDPIARVDVLGCPGKQVSNDTSDAFNSFGTKYKIEPKTIKNSSLDKKLKASMQVGNHEMSNEPSYLCRNIGSGGTGQGEIVKEARNDQCCLELSFTPSDTSLQNEHPIEKTLVYEFVRRKTRSQFREETDPAFRLQRFNGYTDLMGGAEYVPAWRSGLNFYEEPSYGYQAMDFIINSLSSNPKLRELVERTGEKLGVRTPSMLCKGKENSYYSIDTDHYFNKVKNAKRMDAMAKKYKNCLETKKAEDQFYSCWDDLSEREKQVLEQELKNHRVALKLPEILNNPPNYDVAKGMEGYLGLKRKKPLLKGELLPMNEYFLKFEETHGRALTNAEKVDLEQFILSHSKIDTLKAEADVIGQQFIDQWNILFSSLEAYQRNELSQVMDHLINTISTFDNIPDLLDENGKKISFEKFYDGFPHGSLKENSDFINLMKKGYEKIEKTDERIFNQKKSKNIIKKYSKKNGHNGPPLKLLSYQNYLGMSESKDEFRNRMNYSRTNDHRKKVIDYYYDAIASNEMTWLNFDNMADQYFGSLYESRDTLAETSIYKYERFKPHEIQRIGARVE